jgi:hypothetical protein
VASERRRDILEATRDVLGIMRGWYLAERDLGRRAYLSGCARLLQESAEKMAAHEPDTEEFKRASANAEVALANAYGAMGMGAYLEPVLVAASNRLRKIKNQR